MSKAHKPAELLVHALPSVFALGTATTYAVTGNELVPVAEKLAHPLLTIVACIIVWALTRLGKDETIQTSGASDSKQSSMSPLIRYGLLMISCVAIVTSISWVFLLSRALGSERESRATANAMSAILGEPLLVGGKTDLVVEAYDARSIVKDVRDNKVWTGTDEIQDRYNDVMNWNRIAMHSDLREAGRSHSGDVRLYSGRTYLREAGRTVWKPTGAEAWVLSLIGDKWHIQRFLFNIPNAAIEEEVKKLRREFGIEESSIVGGNTR